jgi:hypothetical protein
MPRPVNLGLLALPALRAASGCCLAISGASIDGGLDAGSFGIDSGIDSGEVSTRGEFPATPLTTVSWRA